jgi:hypothetical protein
MTETTQLITTVTALIAVTVGPIVTICVSRRQIRASVVSSNRQQWINNLRDTIADFLAKIIMVRTLNARSHPDISTLPRLEEAMRLGNKIELLLNPKDADHAELAGLIGQLADPSTETDRDLDINGLNRRVVQVSQAILKREWDRVKHGD